MTQQQIAENYVRENLPELMELSFGCLVEKYGSRFTWLHMETDMQSMNLCTYMQFSTMHQVRETVEGVEQFKIIGHPIQLQHWLRVLELLKVETQIQFGTNSVWVRRSGIRIPAKPQGECVKFNLTTGSPSTESDYEAFNDIVKT